MSPKYILAIHRNYNYGEDSKPIGKAYINKYDYDEDKFIRYVAIVYPIDYIPSSNYLFLHINEELYNYNEYEFNSYITDSKILLKNTEILTGDILKDFSFDAKSHKDCYYEQTDDRNVRYYIELMELNDQNLKFVQNLDEIYRMNEYIYNCRKNHTLLNHLKILCQKY